MVVARDALAEREVRLARHCREGFLLTRRDPTYRTTVVTRLHPDLGQAPDDLWTAIPWIWAVVLGGELPNAGTLAAAINDAASVLREWLLGDEPLETLRARWNATHAVQLGLGSTLRSHPFADLRAWSTRLLSAG